VAGVGWLMMKGYMNTVLMNARQTGRTTRMVEDAKQMAAEGKQVAILVHSVDYGRDVRQRHAIPEAIRIVNRRTGTVDFVDWDAARIAFHNSGAMPLFIDHFAIENHYSGMLNQLFRWDAKPGEYGFGRECVTAHLETELAKLQHASGVILADNERLKDELAATKIHRQNLLTQTKDWVRERDVFNSAIGVSNTLITMLRGIITQNVADKEQAEKEAYAAQLVKDQLVAAAQTGASALRAYTDALGNTTSFAATALSKLNDALESAGVTL